MSNKTIILIIVLCAIVGSIWYVESMSIHPRVQRTELGAQIPTNAGQAQSAMDDDVMTQQDKMTEETADKSGSMMAETAMQAAQERASMKRGKYERAVELVEPDGYINTPPFNLSQYVGKKVILVDFWTYSCINCQRTLPYLTAWDTKYRDDGLLVVGVHTPEFDFEKDKANVERAVENSGIKYPVVQDNDFKTWTAYGNRYWPHEYLIDVDGFVVHDHIGEGGYDETERAIQSALQELHKVLGDNATMPNETAGVSVTAPEFSKIKTSEIYVGYSRGLGSVGTLLKHDEERIYTSPESIAPNLVYFEGAWRSEADDARLTGATGSVFLQYQAKKVHIVAGAGSPVNVTVLVDGSNTGVITVGPQDLYTVVNGTDYSEHTVELRSTKGFRLFTFTFG